MDEDQGLAADVDYVALHPLAVVALLLGIASLLSFLGPLLLVIPVLAIGVSLRALSSIDASGGGKKGRRLAYLGGALAVFCAAGAVTRGVVGDALVERQAHDVAQRWIELLAENRFEEALRLITPRKIASMAPRSAPDSPPPSAEELHGFAIRDLQRDPLVTLLRSLGGAPRLESVDWANTPVRERRITSFSGDFLVRPASPPPQLGLFFARADEFEATGAAWRIDGWMLNE